MPINYQRLSAIPDYRPVHVAAAATKAAAGMLYDGTSTTAVAPGSVTITLSTPLIGEMGQLDVGDTLIVDVGAACEKVLITAISVPAKTITATFAQSHSGTYAVRCTRGTDLGTVVINAVGTAMVLTLYNGHPDAGGLAVAVITPVAGASFLFHARITGGLFYTYAGTTAGDVTITALPVLR